MKKYLIIDQAKSMRPDIKRLSYAYAYKEEADKLEATIKQTKDEYLAQNIYLKEVSALKYLLYTLFGVDF